MPATNPRDINFLQLRDAVLCSDCELISYNNTHHCLACGSTAVLSLSRVLGGSLRGEERVRMVAGQSRVLEAELRAVSPTAFCPSRIAAQSAAIGGHWGSGNDGGQFVNPAMSANAERLWGTLKTESDRSGRRREVLLAGEVAGATPAHAAMKLVVERGYRLSRTGGAAIAAERGGRMVCEARMGMTAPALGAEVGSGISALSALSGRTMRCDFAGDDARVDAATCRALGVNSMVAAPIVNLDRVLGVVTVLSPQPYAFDDRDVAVVQWLAGMMAVVFTSAETDLSFVTRSTTRAELPNIA